MLRMPRIEPGTEMQINKMTRRHVFWLWLPLALSFTLMMLEGPTIHSAIARLPDPALSLAAFGAIFGISLIVESPVIMLISTAIALARDAQSYRALRSFMIGLNVGLTLITAAIAFTPLFDLVMGRILGMPPAIVAAGRPAYQIMLFWIAAIGWRRFYQGILVRYGRSNRVSYGTAIRLLSTIGVAFGLVYWTETPGANVGALAVMAGVLSEAIATHLMAMGVVREKLLPNTASADRPLTQRQILAFHAPLAGTSLLTLMVQPVTAAALARLPLPGQTLAAWPVIFSTMLVLRGWGMALQETTVAQAKDERMLPPLREFALIVAVATSAITALLSLTPLLDLYLRRVITLEPELSSFVRLGVQLSIFLPALTALTSWMRGLMVAGGATGNVYRGMMVNLVVNVAGLLLGILLRLPGIPVAAVALICATTLEYGYLRRRLALDERRANAVELGRLAQAAGAEE